MNKPKFEQFKDRFWSVWDNVVNRVEEDSPGSGINKEKVVVFFVAFVLALCLWLLVNLSRDFSLNINLPITLGNMPEDQALAEDIPDFVTVSIQGEGWKLINVYNNPPQIFLDVTSDNVDLYDQVSQQLNAIPDINVQKVQPLSLSINLEDRATKKVPVKSNVVIQFEDQFNLLGEPSIRPDSVTISGAKTIIGRIESWGTDSMAISDVSREIDTEVPLKDPGELLTVIPQTVQLTAEVGEFTENEVKVPVRTRNLPVGRNITFSPSSITVRYSVPLGEYSELRDINPFTAYVTYGMIQEDSTGFVTPRIEVSADRFNINIQGHQPQKVAYFMVIND